MAFKFHLVALWTGVYLRVCRSSERDCKVLPTTLCIHKVGMFYNMRLLSLAARSRGRNGVGEGELQTLTEIKAGMLYEAARY